MASAEINQVIATKIEEDWNLTKDYEPPIDYDLNQEFTALQKRITQSEEVPTKVAKLKPVRPTSRKWMTWATAAAVLLLTVGTWVFFQQPNTSEALVNSIHTDQLQEVQLVDGTKVWVKANSHFQYPNTFQNTRTVQLEGEAFFEVAKNPNKPFIVETKKAAVRVLGTAFNVRATPNEGVTEVIVTEGKVQLSDKAKAEKIQLTANEKGVLQHATNEVSKIQETDMNELAWQTNVLIFKSTPLPEVFNSLKRLFEKDFIMDVDRIQNCAFSGRYSSPDLEEILMDINRDFKLTFSSPTEKIITLEGKGCD